MVTLQHNLSYSCLFCNLLVLSELIFSSKKIFHGEKNKGDIIYFSFALHVICLQVDWLLPYFEKQPTTNWLAAISTKNPKESISLLEFKHGVWFIPHTDSDSGLKIAATLLSVAMKYLPCMSLRHIYLLLVIFLLSFCKDNKSTCCQVNHPDHDIKCDNSRIYT